MDRSVPSFSIFLPVRNGGKYLPLCVESILAQSYPHFNLVILENNSTDGTSEWLQALERKDTRIKVLPSDKALSIEDNWQRILAVPKNDFMTIIGHDDLLDSDYLQVMSSLITKYPDAGLYHAHFRLIKENGEAIKKCSPMPLRLTNAEFLNGILNFSFDSFGTGYVMRSASYEEVGGIPKFRNLLFADHVLWMHLLRESWKATAQQECFSYRVHGKSTTKLSSGMDYLEGLEKFVEGLGENSKQDHAISLVCKDELPTYVSVAHRAVYLNHLYMASQNNKIVESNVRPSVVYSLERLQPNLVHEFNASMLIRILELLNKSIWRRPFSNMWGLYRYFRDSVLRGLNA